MSKSSPRRGNCLAFVMLHLRIGGCWPSWTQKNEWRERLYLVYSATMYGMQFTTTIILFCGLVIQCRDGWNTLEEGVEDIVVFSTVFIILLKMVLILRHNTKLRILYKSINGNMNNPEFLTSDSSATIESCIKHEKRLVLCYSFFGHSTTVLYIVSSIIRFWNSQKHVLPIKFPFQPTGKLFWVVYLHQVFSMIGCGHMGTLVDSLFSSFAFYISVQFEILSKRVKSEGSRMSKKFIAHHNEVIGMARQLESIYGVFLTFELTVTSALLCLGMVQVTQTEGIHLFYYLKCLIYVSGKLIQMVLYCWYGDRVIEKSGSISHSAYFGSWHEMRKKQIGTHLSMIMLRSQRPVVIRGGSYIRVSLPTMATVINTAYTFFTMLRSFR